MREFVGVHLAIGHDEAFQLAARHCQHDGLTAVRVDFERFLDGDVASLQPCDAYALEVHEGHVGPCLCPQRVAHHGTYLVTRRERRLGMCQHAFEVWIRGEGLNHRLRHLVRVGERPDEQVFGLLRYHVAAVDGQRDVDGTSQQVTVLGDEHAVV